MQRTTNGLGSRFNYILTENCAIVESSRIVSQPELNFYMEKVTRYQVNNVIARFAVFSFTHLYTHIYIYVYIHLFNLLSYFTWKNK